MTPEATTQTSATPVTGASQLSPDFPWPGFAPYEEADRAYFHSRRLETEEMLRLLSRDVLTLLIGPTGVGKTSLVQAALVPALVEGESLPVVARLDWFSLPPPPKPSSDESEVVTGPGGPIDNPLTRQLISVLQAAASLRGITAPAWRDGDSLWEYFHRSGHRWWSNRQRVITPVLIIDRFEEAFTVGRANATAKRQAESFFEELSELANNRPPSRLAAGLESGEKPGDAYVFENVPVRLLLVMREEFTARLTDLKTVFPTLRRSQFRLAPFSTSQARDGIHRSAAQRNLFADGAVDSVVEFLASEGPGEQTILPAHLSVVCSALSIERAQRGGAAITREFLAVRPGRLMHDFITAAVSDLPPAARALLEEHLTDLRGNSQRVPLNDALSRTGLPRDSLDTLVQRHLVRIDNLSAIPYVSLAHDLLAGVLAITRLERIAQAREQSAVLHKAQTQAQIEAQAATVANKVRQQRTVTWMVGAAATIVIGVAVAAAINMSRKAAGLSGPNAASATGSAHLSTPTPAPPLSTPAPVTPANNPSLTAPGEKATAAESGVAATPAKSTPTPAHTEPSIPESKPDRGEPGSSPARPPDFPSSLPRITPPTPAPPLATPVPQSSASPAESPPATPPPAPLVDVGAGGDSPGRSPADLDDQQRRRFLQERRRSRPVAESRDEDTQRRAPAPPRTAPARPAEVRPAGPVPPPAPKATPRTLPFNRF